MPKKAYVTHVTEEITPELAVKYLEQNNRNRPIREPRVRLLARDMQAGRWKENGEAGVTFDWNGDIAGGQHTLTAITRSGVTIRCRVTRGVDPAARDTMNDSFKQQFGDDLHVAGVPSASHAATLLRKAIIWTTAENTPGSGGGGLARWRTTKFTHSQLAEEWPSYAAGITAAIKDAEPYREDWPGNNGALQFLCWLLIQHEGCNPETVRDFLARITYGSQAGEDKMLVKLRARFFAGERHAEQQVYWLLRVWNAWVKGGQLVKLRLPAGRVITDPYPKPRKA